MDSKSRILIIGCGSIGIRHISNLMQLGYRNIIVADPDRKRLSIVNEKFKITEAYKDYQEALKKDIEIAFVCTPPNSHVPIALKALRYNLHLFIEKPISNTYKDVEKLIRLAKLKKVKIAVGYNLRFSPGLILAKKLIDSKAFGNVIFVRAEFGQSLPDWRPTLDYRKNYTARKNMGGGILLDGSHEVDYLRWLLGDIKELTCVAGRLGNLEVDTESIAELIVRFQHNVLGSIHVDFLRPVYNRHCEFICDTGIILWNFSDKEVKTFDKRTNKWKTYHIKQDANHMYVQEVKAFLDAIRYNRTDYTDVTEGAKTLKVILEAKRSSKSGKRVVL